MTESELRQNGMSWDEVQRDFIWNSLSKDFIRQLVAHKKEFRKNLELQMLADVHGWSKHPSMFYQNMYNYLKMGLAEEKQLACYADQIYVFYREAAQREYEASKPIYSFVDGCGRVLYQASYNI